MELVVKGLNKCAVYSEYIAFLLRKEGIVSQCECVCQFSHTHTSTSFLYLQYRIRLCIISHCMESDSALYNTAPISLYIYVRDSRFSQIKNRHMGAVSFVSKNHLLDEFLGCFSRIAQAPNPVPVLFVSIRRKKTRNPGVNITI